MVFVFDSSTNNCGWVKTDKLKGSRIVIERSYFLWNFSTLGSPKWASEGFWNAGNNPMVGMTVSVAVAVEESLKK